MQVAYRPVLSAVRLVAAWDGCVLAVPQPKRRDAGMQVLRPDEWQRIEGGRQLFHSRLLSPQRRAAAGKPAVPEDTHFTHAQHACRHTARMTGCTTPRRPHAATAQASALWTWQSLGCCRQCCCSSWRGPPHRCKAADIRGDTELAAHHQRSPKVQSHVQVQRHGWRRLVRRIFLRPGDPARGRSSGQVTVCRSLASRYLGRPAGNMLCKACAHK